MSDKNWLEKAFFKPIAGKRLARSVMATVVVVALVLGVGLVSIAPLTKTARAGQAMKMFGRSMWPSGQDHSLLQLKRMR